MTTRARVRCQACGGPARRARPKTVAAGCPVCGGPLTVCEAAEPIRRGPRTTLVTIRLVESEMLELAPRDGWSGYLRRMVAAAVEAKRAELAARSRRASTG